MRGRDAPGLFASATVEFPALRLPPSAPGQRIGLFGGSFNPPHRGHRHVALMALKRLALDRVWWLVTPGNPMKANDGLPPLACRVAAAKALATHPQMAVTAVEAALDVRYSADVVRLLRKRLPDRKLVWLMGADNLASLHRWQHWRELMRTVPIAVVDRPGASLSALNAPAANAFAFARRPEADARTLAEASPPAWVFLHVPLEPVSSTALRSTMTVSPSAS